MIRLTAIASVVGPGPTTGALAEPTSDGGFVHVERVPNGMFWMGEIAPGGAVVLRRAR